MSRAGYSEDIDNWALIKWRGQVVSATRGRRGQKLLRDILAALDAMPEKRLIAKELEADGKVCTLGALGRARGIDMSELEPDEPGPIAAAFDIAEPLAREIMYVNDEHFDFEYVNGKRIDVSPEERWNDMRKWVAARILPEAKNGR